MHMNIGGTPFFLFLLNIYFLGDIGNRGLVRAGGEEEEDEEESP